MTAAPASSPGRPLALVLGIQRPTLSADELAFFRVEALLAAA